jgi:phosphoribosylformylglycinamidine synthase
MAKPKVAILRSAGINCDEETLHAWRLAGADPAMVHLNDAVAKPAMISDCDILTLPGGFSFGDDISAGAIFASRLGDQMSEAMRRLVERGGLILGICNGFQILVKIGLLSVNDEGTPCSLAMNASGRFTCRWVTVETGSAPCAFLESGRKYALPIAHAEGRLVTGKQGSVAANRIALRYGEGMLRIGPDNPNGSVQDIAGLMDDTGRILGLMPHPERYVRHTQHPFWTSLPEVAEPDGLAIFRTAVKNVG